MTEQFNQVYELSLTSPTDSQLSNLQDVFDLYDSILKGLRADANKAHYLAERRLENEAKLKAQLEDLSYELSTIELLKNNPPSPVVAPVAVVEEQLSSFERCQYETKLERLQEQLDEVTVNLNAVRELLVDTRVEKTRLSELVDGLNEQLSTSKQSNSSLAEDLEKITAERDGIKEALTSQLTDNLELRTELEVRREDLTRLANSIVTVKGERKAAVSDKNKAEKKLAAVERENEVLTKETSKFRQYRKESRDAIEAARAAMRDATQHFDGLSNELANVRMERRYLTMMVDSLNHTDFFETKNGILALYSFQPEKILVSTEPNNYEIDIKYPLGLWVMHSGVCCIVAVSKNCNAKGERELIVPKVEGMSMKGQKLISPNATDCGLIADELMKYDAIACEAALDRCRQINSNIARCTNDDENRTLSNQNLKAFSKPAGKSIIANKTTHSAKRKKKR